MKTIRLILIALIAFFALAVSYGVGIKSLDLVLDAGMYLLGCTLTLTFISFARA